MLLIFSMFGYAQNVKFNFGGQITNYETGKKEAGVTISVVANGVNVATSKTASNGKYIVNFDLNAKSKYDIVFSKGGFVTKRVAFNLSDLNVDGLKEGQKLSPLTDLSLEIFSVKPGIDFSFLDNEPVAKFNANPKSSGLQLDVSASQRMKQKIEGLLDKSGNAVDDTDVKYNEAMQKGQKLFSENKLEEALKQYEAAAFLKPKEFQPQKKIAEIDALLRAKKEESYAVNETDQQYNNYIKAADNFRDKKQYKEAISKYRAAQRVKNEQYPKDEVAKIEKIINDLAGEERTAREYQAAVEAGDAAMSAKQYSVAVAEYNKAITLRENEKYPKDQLALAQEELEALASAKEKQDSYDAAMKEANNLFAGSKFEEAKLKYQEALTVLPNESMPKERIKMCDDQIAKLAQALETEAQINKLFEEGQALIDKKDFILAKGPYKKILGLDPTKNLAQVKLDEIDRLIKEAQDLKSADDRFAKYVKGADASVLEEDFAMAKQMYGAALEIKDDAVVQEKYNAVLSKMANKEAKALVAQKYAEIMDEAKALLDADELEKARLKYQNATSIDETQQEPKLRINEIDARLNKNVANDKQYREWIDKGDALVASRDYLEAIKMFDNASQMKPSEAEPKDKAKNAARLSSESKEEANALFEKMIAAARNKINDADYTKARDYVNRAISNRALKARPEDRRPEDMLNEIDFLEKTEKEYNELVAQAEVDAGAKEYKKAIASYKAASLIRPKEEVPPQRIKELSTIFNGLQNSAEIEKKYQENLKKGVSEMGIKSYEMALESFTKAQSFKPNDQIVQDKISEVQQILDDQKKALANAEERKIEVDKLVKEANILFEKRDWSQAKIKYNQAVGLDPGQPFSVARIVECDAKLQAEMDKVAEAEYNELVANADNNFEKKDFLRSKELFEKANILRPSEKYPIDRLAEIERLMNPTIIASSLLEPLGDVYTGEDADLALLKAETKRKTTKSEEFLKVKNSAIEVMEEKSVDLQTKTYQTQADLNAVHAKVRMLADDSDDRRHDNVEQVKLIKYKTNTDNAERSEYNKATNLADQEKLNYIQVDIDEQKEKADFNIKMKAAKMKQNSSDLMVADHDRSMKYSKASISKGKQMSQISIEAQESMNDDESRRLTEAQLKLAKESASQKMTELTESNEAKVEHNQDRFREIVAINEIRGEAFVDKRETRYSEIRAIEMTNIEKGAKSNDRQTQKYIENKAHINNQVNVQTRVGSENAKRLRADQTLLKKIISGSEQNMNDRATTDQDIAVHTQSTLDYINIKRAESDVVIANRNKVNGVLLKDARNETAAVGEKMNADKQESLYGSQASINKVKASIEAQATESTDKQMKNASAIDDIYTLESIKTEELAKKASGKQQNIKDKINSVDTNPAKIKAKNSLGMDFEEGVTEEQFTRSGSDGTIHTVITRRVVVIDGHGDVYVRTRRGGMATYKKNNASITEYAWQKETQNSHLVRH